MKHSTNPIFLLLLILLPLAFASCGDDDEQMDDNEEMSDTQFPTPTDADAVLVGINTITTTSVAGFSSDLAFGTAVAIFPDGDEFTTAGSVSVNNQELTRSSNNAYSFSPSLTDPTSVTGIVFNDVAEWEVSGDGDISPFSATASGFPDKATITSATTLDLASDYTFSWNGVSGADSIIASVIGNSSIVMKTVVGNADSATFDSAELSSLGTTDQGILQVAAYTIDRETIAGNNVYLINQTVSSEAGVTFE